jgi:hypothetical protein
MRQEEALWQRMATIALAVLAGVIPALFLIFKALISDVPPGVGAATSVVLYGVAIVIVYAMAGAAFGYMAPKRSSSWGVWLSLPVTFPLAVALVREPARLLTVGTYAVLAVCASSAASYGAARIRSRAT